MLKNVCKHVALESSKAEEASEETWEEGSKLAWTKLDKNKKTFSITKLK